MRATSPASRSQPRKRKMEISTAGRIRAWVEASRPATLPAAVVPVVVGTAAAISQGYFRWGVLVCAMLASIMIQIGTNYANDYFDHKQGADTTERLGPVRLIQSGIAAPERVFRAALISFGIAAVFGVYLVFVGGWPILVVGILSILAGIAYTGGPYPLGYNGLGDLFVFIFFGVVGVVGTYYLHAGVVSALAWWASVPVGMLVTAILVVNNVRDIETDRKVGKKTLAVRIGRSATLVQYVLFLIIAYLVPLGLWLARQITLWFWLPWLTLPLAYVLARTVIANQDGPTLNRALRQTGRLHLIFGILFAVSLVL